ncbi:hypothetical protein SISNIDRAFT_471805 [Sistotremastrum niveocremeum HHB9708]|uniref:Uncharacterized protein n=1 Tax=Sistotremastrum niveocremeum HHB9708 TaxID=1314777 RepID=A0A164M6W7_9AGAM|nr:hypothetical protein SISNIDRAFT_471805 [Sistotremastrum niveocremeum HHB9708]
MSSLFCATLLQASYSPYIACIAWLPFTVPVMHSSQRDTGRDASSARELDQRPSRANLNPKLLRSQRYPLSSRHSSLLTPLDGSSSRYSRDEAWIWRMTLDAPVEYNIPRPTTLEHPSTSAITLTFGHDGHHSSSTHHAPSSMGENLELESEQGHTIALGIDADGQVTESILTVLSSANLPGLKIILHQPLGT